ncbi:MAG TPA: GNAT family protein [Thermoplasmata archaeon]|nr:GNAT family protein [Thermoplasmata archaeon]
MSARRSTILRGPRVSLGLIDERDVPSFVRWMSDLEMTMNLGNFGFIPTPENETEWIRAGLKNERNRLFGIVLNRGTRHIGNCGLHELDMSSRHAMLGIAIGEKACWGKGYGREAVRLLCDFGFNVLGLHSIHLTVFGFNVRGIKAYEAVGFRESGRLREARRYGTQWVDSVYMDILEDEFRERWESVVPGVTRE